MTTGPSILFIDDHPALRLGLEEILTDSLQSPRFGHAGNADEAIDEVKNHRWDLVILDLNLPGGKHGMELIPLLKDLQPDLGILVFSVHSEAQFGYRAMRAGADGYLGKDKPLDEISKAVRSILDGGRYLSPSLTETLVTGIKGRAPDGHHLLSDREIQVLRLLAQGKSATEIGIDLSLSIKTVSTYRARVLEKLKLRSNADLIRYAMDQGIVD